MEAASSFTSKLTSGYPGGPHRVAPGYSLIFESPRPSLITDEARAYLAESHLLEGAEAVAEVRQVGKTVCIAGDVLCVMVGRCRKLGG